MLKAWYGCVVNDSSSALGKEVSKFLPPLVSGKSWMINKELILHGSKKSNYSLIIFPARLHFTCVQNSFI